MDAAPKRNRLMPWFIGLVITVLAVGYVAYQMVATNCQVTLPIALIVLGVLPIVYMVLMYLAFVSQD